MKHDYKATIEALQETPYGTHLSGGLEILRMNETIRHALAMMQKLDKPSRGMIDAGYDSAETGAGFFASTVFKAMLEQAEKELQEAGGMK